MFFFTVFIKDTKYMNQFIYNQQNGIIKWT